MKLYKVSVGRTELEALPENELTFFIQAGRVLNEIGILHKLTIFSNKEAGTEVERKAQNSQSVFLLSILAGKLWEGWELLQKAYFGAKLSKHYQRLLPSSANDSLDNLKRYFSKGENLIKKIRDKIAFHYDSPEVIAQFGKTPQDEVFEIYISEDQGNSLYYISNVLLINAILEWTGIPDPLKAIDSFFEEVLSAAGWFIDFFNHCLAAMAQENWNLQEITIPSPPKITEVAIPFFVGKP
jgi:hypothetical protein